MSWEPADDDNFIGYVIHYHSNEGPAAKFPVHNKETEKAKLDLLERGVPYIISIEALSHNLTNSTVGPYTFFGK